MHIKLIGKLQIITHDDETLRLPLTASISKQSDEYDPTKAFYLLNAFLDFKGPKFKEELFNKIKESYEDIQRDIITASIERLPVKGIHAVLDMFDLDEMFKFLKFTQSIRVPGLLHEKFDKVKEKDTRGTEVRTYTKDQYIELASLFVIGKSVLGLIGFYTSLHAGIIPSKHKEYSVFNFIRKHKIFNSIPFKKLIGLIKEVIKPEMSNDESQIRLIEKSVSAEELPYFILSIVFLQKAMMSIVEDTDTKHIVTACHNYTTNKLRPKNDVGTAIRAKKTTGPGSDDDGEESTAEIYRILTDKPAAFIAEARWEARKIDKVIRSLPIELDPRVLSDATKFIKKIGNRSIISEQVFLLPTIFRRLGHPKSFMYLDMETITGLFAVAFAFLWQVGLKELALLICSFKIELDEDVLYVNSTSNRSRVTTELKDLLEQYYVYERPISAAITGQAQKSVSLPLETIANLSKGFFASTLVTVADEKYILEATGNKSTNISLPADLKIQLAKLILYTEDPKLIGTLK